MGCKFRKGLKKFYMEDECKNKKHNATSYCYSNFFSLIQGFSCSYLWPLPFILSPFYFSEEPGSTF